MKLHLLSFARRLSRQSTGRGAAVLASSFGLAAFFATSQAIAQTRIAGNAAAWSYAEAALQRDMTVPSIQTEISAPVPTVEEAKLVSPLAIPMLSITRAQDSGQSSPQSATQSSSQDSPAPTTSTKAAAARSKPPHRGLGIALAVVGTTALVAGVVAYSVSRIDICSNEHSGGCQEARDAGLALMPVGGAVAVTGFYLQFHR